MRDNVRIFVKVCSEIFDMPEPIFEIGSMQVPGQEGYANLRSLFPKKTYVGCDIRHGPGVDRIEDVEAMTLADETVGTVIIVDTLEHLENPHRASNEIFRVLRKGGVAIVTSILNFPIHNYPRDFWRFTPESFNFLLRKFQQRTIGAQGEPLNPHTVFAIAFKAGGTLESALLDSFWQRFSLELSKHLSSIPPPEETAKGKILKWIASLPPVRRRIPHIVRVLQAIRPEPEELYYKCYESSTIQSSGRWRSHGGNAFFERIP